MPKLLTLALFEGPGPENAPKTQENLPKWRLSGQKEDDRDAQEMQDREHIAQNLNLHLIF